MKNQLARASLLRRGDNDSCLVPKRHLHTGGKIHFPSLNDCRSLKRRRNPFSCVNVTFWRTRPFNDHRLWRNFHICIYANHNHFDFGAKSRLEERKFLTQKSLLLMASVGDPFVVLSMNLSHPFNCPFLCCFVLCRSRKKFPKRCIWLCKLVDRKKLLQSRTVIDVVSEKFFDADLKRSCGAWNRKEIFLSSLTFNDCQADETRCVEGFDSLTHTPPHFTSSLHHAWERKKVFLFAIESKKKDSKEKNFRRWFKKVILQMIRWCTWCKFGESSSM